jgi:hypothetical protein
VESAIVAWLAPWPFDCLDVFRFRNGWAEAIRGAEQFYGIEVVLEGMLAREGDDVHLYSGVNKYLAVLMETIKGFRGLCKCINTDGVPPDKIAEVKECGKASDHITRYMARNGRQVNL